ncbi:MAG: DMT family transporter [Pseudomonadota bacterium]
MSDEPIPSRRSGGTQGLLGLRLLLIAAGIGWGATISFGKIAASGEAAPLALAVWQLTLMVVLLATRNLALRETLPLTRQALFFYAGAGVLGAALPNTLSYWAIPHVPAGVVSITYALIPMMTYGLAFAVGQEAAARKRFFGMVFGLGAVILLIGPNIGAAGSLKPFWMLIVLTSAFCYECEGVFAAFAMPEGVNPLTLLFGMSIAGLLLALPAVFVTGTGLDPTVLTGREALALLGATLMHLFAYSTLLLLIRRAGAVFASQISYVVTFSGVLWGLVLFGEVHSGSVWIAMALALAGLALVNPRKA